MPFSKDEQASWISQTYLADATVHEEIDSTNDEGKRLARVLPPNRVPHLVLAMHQTRGRGQGSKSWFSNQHSLTFSVVLDQPKSRAEQAPPLSLFVGLEICLELRRSVQAVGENVSSEYLPRIKWPNDILIGGRKVCGILVESTSEPFSRCVIGCGVNVNQPTDELPQNVRTKATSMRLATNQTTDMSALLTQLIGSTEKACLDYAMNANQLVDRWAKCDALTGSQIALHLPSETIYGDYAGIDSAGRIQIVVNEKMRGFSSGSVEVL